MTKPQETRVMKIIVPALCPHCSKEIMVCNKLITPNIEWVLKPEDLEAAKKTVLDEINKVDFADESEKEYILEYLNNPETIFGPDEVTALLAQMLPKAKEDAIVEPPEVSEAPKEPLKDESK